MRSVVAVAEATSFSGAAEQLRATPQMVSKQVKAFEERLGVRIFDRTTRRVRLTEVGGTGVERCRALVQDFDELEHVVQGKRGYVQGRVRISAPPFGELYLGPALGRFSERFEHVVASMILTDRFVNLLDEGVDIAVRIGRLDDSSLVARRVGTTSIHALPAPTISTGPAAPLPPASW